MSKKSVMRAIKAKCLDCSADDRNEVKLCEIETCPLWVYRMGKDPDTKRSSDKKSTADPEIFKKLKSKK